MCVCACVYGKTLYITTSAGVPQLFYTRYILIPIPRHIHVHTYIHMHMCCSIQFVRWPVFISFWFLVFSLVFLISVSHTRCVILLLCSVFAMCCAVLFSCWAVLFAPIFFYQRYQHARVFSQSFVRSWRSGTVAPLLLNFCR